MNNESIEKIISAVREIASAEVKSKFRQLSNDEVFEKTSSMDLVTEVDMRVERRLHDAFQEIMPEALIVGEEAVSSQPELLEQLVDAPLAVVIDPVDGTWNFAHGISVVGTIVAVVEKGVTTFGLLYDPLQDDWVYASKGQGAFWQNSLGDRKHLQIDSTYQGVGLCSPYLFDDTQKPQLAEKLLNFRRIISLGCACHAYRTLTTGGADFFFTQKRKKPWDHLAGLLVHEEAGGYAALLDGTPYSILNSDQNLLAASSREVWHSLSKILALK